MKYELNNPKVVKLIQVDGMVTHRDSDGRDCLRVTRKYYTLEGEYVGSGLPDKDNAELEGLLEVEIHKRAGEVVMEQLKGASKRKK